MQVSLLRNGRVADWLPSLGAAAADRVKDRTRAELEHTPCVYVAGTSHRSSAPRGRQLGALLGAESYDEIRLRLMVGLRWKIDITAANATACVYSISVA